MYTFFSKHGIQQIIAGALLLVYTILITGIPLEAYAAGQAPVTGQSQNLGIPNMKNSGTSATAPFSMNQNAPAVTLGTGVVSCLVGATLTLTSSLTSSAAAGFGIGTTLTNFGNAIVSWVQDLISGKTTSVDTSNERNTRSSAAGAGAQTGQAYNAGANTIANNTSMGALLAGREEGMLGCIARTIARAILQQIAISTINWINSGFNGSPSFVPNYQTFFQNAADYAAGAFIQGTDFAFLCSPFQLQIRIAIAKSYAGYSRTPSCSLTGVTNNVNAFMNRFDQGGWQAFVSFTTTPTNNPFGGFLYMQGMIQGKMADAAGKKRNDLSMGSGFLSTTQSQNCQHYTAQQMLDKGGVDMAGKSQAWDTDGSNGQTVCDEVQVTPGRAIGDSLSNATKTGQDELINAKYFDEIINALVTQLMTNMLQGGLSSMSAGSGYGSNSYGSTNYSQLRNSVSNSIPGYIQNAQQIIAAEQQNIAVASSSMAVITAQEACWMNIVNSCQVGATTTIRTLTNGTIVTTTTGYAPADCATAAQNASSTMQTNLAQAVQQLQGIIDQASSTIDSLNAFQAQLTTTPDTNPTALGQLITMFSQNVSNGVYPDNGAVNNVLEAQTVVQGQLAQLQQNSTSSTTACLAIKPQSTTSTTTPNAPVPRSN